MARMRSCSPIYVAASKRGSAATSGSPKPLHDAADLKRTVWTEPCLHAVRRGRGAPRALRRPPLLCTVDQHDLMTEQAVLRSGGPVRAAAEADVCICESPRAWIE